MARTERADDDLVRAARQGDREAFDLLVARYRGRVDRLARRLLPSEAAEDCAQATILRSWERIGQLDEGASFLAWLLAICRRTAADMARAEATRRRYEEAFASAAAAV